MQRFEQIVKAYGETVTLYPIQPDGSYGQGQDVKAFVVPARVDEVLIEPGYLISDYIVVYMAVSVKHRDRIRRKGVDYEVYGVQVFDWRGETAYYRANCRRLIGV